MSAECSSSANADGIARRRVVVVDHRPMIRAVIRRWGDGAAEFLVIAEAKCAAEATQVVSRLQPDVVIVALGLPGQGGVDACREATQCAPRTAVLLLGEHESDSALTAAWDAGARGFVSERADLPDLVDAVQRASDGGLLFTADQIRRIRAWQAGMGRRLPELTNREWEVLRLLLAGGDNRKIAAALVLSENTVEKHVGSVLGKLGFKHRTNLLAFALREPLGLTSHYAGALASSSAVGGSPPSKKGCRIPLGEDGGAP